MQPAQLGVFEAVQNHDGSWMAHAGKGAVPGVRSACAILYWLKATGCTTIITVSAISMPNRNWLTVETHLVA